LRPNGNWRKRSEEIRRDQKGSKRDQKSYFLFLIMSLKLIIRQSVKCMPVKHNLIYSLIIIKLATCFDPIGSSSGLHYEPFNVID
jgi:hypothetical protein